MRRIQRVFAIGAGDGTQFEIWSNNPESSGRGASIRET